MDINDSANKVSDKNEEHGRQNLNHKETVSRNIKVVGSVTEGLEGNEHVVRN